MSTRARLVVALACCGVLVGVAVAVGVVYLRNTSDLIPLHTVSDPRVGEPVSAPPGAPNVVVILGCTLRRDQLSVYQPELATTPYLLRLAERGVAFDDMVTTAPWTRPASTSILTGRHAVHVGMVEPGQGLNTRRLSNSVLTMAEHFRDHGWHTFGATANPNVGSTWNLHQGFDLYLEPSRIWAEGAGQKQRSGPLRAGLVEAVSKAGGGPVYLQAMFIESHAPWRPVDPDVVLSDPETPEAVHRYRGEVHRFDQAVQRFFEELGGLGLTEANTVFVVLNDHGEGLNMPEHHGLAHGRYLYPSTVGGVWVMAGPGVPKRRIAGVASQVDVFPTLAELAGIPLSDPGDGMSQVKALKSGRSLRERAYSDTWFSKIERSAVYTGTSACQRDWDGEQGERFVDGCFDRASDPEHRTPVQMPDLEEDLRDWKADAMTEMAAFGDTANVKADPATTERLRKLGYVE